MAGEQSAKWYFETINKLMDTQQNFAEHINCLKIDFETINALLPYRLEEAAHFLEPYFKVMEQDKLPYIMANITLHETVEYFKIKPKYALTIRQILQDATVTLNGSFAILGTKFTMNHQYIQSMFRENQIINLPENLQNEIDVLRQIYYSESNPKLAKRVFKKLQQLDINYFIIACTELAIAYSDTQQNLSLINLPHLQCEYLIDQVGNHNL